ncbi:MAG: NAD(P)-dependent oxidoreductase [Alphaproteobacteria bacterium]|nr:NAD(P)-dependent oxidoreductase [Alphaproteobacteria bacterium]
MTDISGAQPNPQPDPAGRRGRLAGAQSRGDLAANFADIKPPFSPAAALVEASRCYFCHDAPCVEACPTGIDIPQFIAKIASGNLKGSAVEILKENIFGGSCARVCPTEILCERACVRMTQESKPVAIGRLQRHATDHLMGLPADEGGQPFARAAATAKTVAIVGAGPAGLACAHALSLRGHETVVFEARDKGGGLNEYGIAAYKVPDDFAQSELAFILRLGGIELRCGSALGRDVTLAQLHTEYDAVFLSIGLGGARSLDIDGAELSGVVPAVDYIARLRQADDLGRLPVADKVVVIGGGNTAIDIAVQSKRLGAREVTIGYRRGPTQMGATDHEQAFAQTDGVAIRHWVQPYRILGADGRVVGIELERTALDGDGRVAGTGVIDVVAADMVFVAIGQYLVGDMLDAGDGSAVVVEGGRIVVDARMQTNVKGIFSGGDCVASGDDLTVQSVEDGKRAAANIHSFLS